MVGRFGQFRNFEDARTYVRAEGLRSVKEYNLWCKGLLTGHNPRPTDIPLTPYNVYRDKWQGMGDFLGTGRIGSRSRKYRSWEAARSYVRSEGICSQKEYSLWCKGLLEQHDPKPTDIPANPNTVYKDEWQGMGDFLGTYTIASRDRKYRSFEDARAFVRNEGLHDAKEYALWSQGLLHGHDVKPVDIPSTADQVYKGEWRGWGDFLAVKTVMPYKRLYRSFVSARAHVHAEGLRNSKEYSLWCKGLLEQHDPKPTDIPANPNTVYKDEWQGMGDFLGTDFVARVNRKYRSFEDARAFVRNEGLHDAKEYALWSQGGLEQHDPKPTDIPASPWRLYKDKWRGWSDFLGVRNQWTAYALIAFLTDMTPALPALTESDLWRLLRHNGLDPASSQFKSPRTKAAVRHLWSVTQGAPAGQVVRQTIAILADVGDDEDMNDDAAIHQDERPTDVDSLSPLLPTPSGASTIAPLPIATSAIPQEIGDAAQQARAILTSIDALSRANGATEDDDADGDGAFVASLIESARAKLWRLALAADSMAPVLLELVAYPAGAYAARVRQEFTDEWNAVTQLPVPDGYAYHVNGLFAPPLLMQRLIAHRVLTRRYIGNWSAPGAGKTLSAILASRVVDARFTVVVAANSTLLNSESGWAGEIHAAFPDSRVLLKERGPYALTLDADGDRDKDAERPTYLLLNYEAFQQEDGEALTARILDAGRVDMIVLDEMHNAKHGTLVASKRHGVIRRFVERARMTNPDLRVLGMTATPVINHLAEGVDLLETVTGVEDAALETKPTIANALDLHERFILSCFRAIPTYAQEVVITYPRVDGLSLLDRLAALQRGDVSGMERALTAVKLPAIEAALTPGTVIYTHYTTGVIGPLRDAVARAGLRAGVCTGQTQDNAATIAAFIAGDLDVLIGSPVIREGLDGLQQRCDRLIVASLPWHHAGYQQLMGRIYRQGSRFARIEVVIPQVEIAIADEVWSWDHYRKAVIDYKKTIADTAVDGVLPTGAALNEKEMLNRSVDALRVMIARLQVAA